MSLFDSFFVSSGHSYPLHEGHCLTCMWLGCPAKFFLCDSPCQLYCIGSMDAEEDDQDFRRSMEALHEESRYALSIPMPPVTIVPLWVMTVLAKDEA